MAYRVQNLTGGIYSIYLNSDYGAVAFKAGEIKDLDLFCPVRCIIEGNTELTNLLNSGLFVLVYDSNPTIPSSIYDIRDYDSLYDAITEIGSEEVTLVIPEEQVVSSNLTIPSNITLEFTNSGKIKPANGVTVTVLGKINPIYKKIFNTSSGGSIVFDSSGIGYIYSQWFGAAGDGSTDDTTAIQATFNSITSGNTVFFPLGNYYITNIITISTSCTITGEKAVIKHNMPNTLTSWTPSFLLNTSNIEVRSIVFDGSSQVKADTNTIAHLGIRILGTSFTSKINNIKILNCTIQNFNTTNGNNHGIQLQYCENITIDNCKFNTLDNAAIMLYYSDNITISNNYVDNTGWYTFHIEDSVRHVVFENNTFDTNVIANYGGMIDCMGKALYQTCENIKILNNTIHGEFQYGAAIRIAGVKDLLIKDNTIDAHSDTTGSSIIRLGDRDISGVGPCSDAIICNNTLIATEADRNVGVRISTRQSGSDTGQNFKIYDNNMISNGTYYFNAGVQLGSTVDEGKIYNIDINNNTIQHKDTAGFSGGSGILLSGSTNGTLNNIRIISNYIYSATNDDSTDIGVYLSSYTNNVTIIDNILDNCFRPIRVDGTTHTNTLILNNQTPNMNASGYDVVATQEFTADDTSPSLLGSNLFKTNDSNTATITIQLFNDMSVGQVYCILGNDSTNNTVIQNNAFNRLKDGDWLGISGNSIVLYCNEPRKTIELYRYTKIDSQTMLENTIDAIGSTEKTIDIREDISITSDITIPSNITLNFIDDGMLSISNNATVTFEGNLQAPIKQIFDPVTTSSVSFDSAVGKIYPQWWGAAGDGSTDDTNAIQETINSIGSYSTKIFFPSGTYMISSVTISDNSIVTLEGENRESSILQQIASQSSSMIKNSASGYIINFNANNLKFDGNSDNQTNYTVSTIEIKVVDCLIKNCYFYKTIHSGIDITEFSGSIIITKNKFENMKGHGGSDGETSYATYIDGDTDNGELWFTDNYIDGGTISDPELAPCGINISPQVGFYKKVYIESNTFINTGTAYANNLVGSINLYRNCDGSIIRNNKIYNTYSEAIHIVRTNDVIIEGNIIDGQGDSTYSTVGISFVQRDPATTIKRIKIIDNTLKNAANMIGININGASSKEYYDVDITGNIIESFQSGIVLSFLKGSINICRNIILDCQGVAFADMGIYLVSFDAATCIIANNVINNVNQNAILYDGGGSEDDIDIIISSNHVKNAGPNALYFHYVASIGIYDNTFKDITGDIMEVKNNTSAHIIGNISTIGATVDIAANTEEINTNNTF